MGLAARRFLKGVMAQLLHHLGGRDAVSAIRRVRSGGRRVAIVSYHRVVEDFSEEVKEAIPGLLIAKETFRRQLEAAWRAGYQFASLAEGLEVLSGKRQAAKDLLVVTFDDGYRDVVQNAVPLLERMGVPATIYLPSGLIGTGRRLLHDQLYLLLRAQFSRVGGNLAEARQGLCAALDALIADRPAGTLAELAQTLSTKLGVSPEAARGELLDWDEARWLSRRGFSLGAHTVEHVVLTHEQPARIDQELAESKAQIERETGSPVLDFAYCNGWYSNEVISSLVRNGYRSAVTTEDLPNVLGADPYTIKRKVLWEGASLGALGRFSDALAACQFDDVFGFLGLRRPVLGRRAGPSIAEA